MPLDLLITRHLQSFPFVAGPVVLLLLLLLLLFALRLRFRLLVVVSPSRGAEPRHNPTFLPICESQSSTDREILYPVRGYNSYYVVNSRRRREGRKWKTSGVDDGKQKEKGRGTGMLSFEGCRLGAMDGFPRGEKKYINWRCFVVLLNSYGNTRVYGATKWDDNLRYRVTKCK